MSRRTYDSRGNEIVLVDELGRGGEGAVYRIAGRENEAAKIYHQALPPTRQEKLRRMVEGGSEILKKFCAWPIETIHDRPGGSVVGFIMPLVKASTPVHALYSPAQRKRDFPDRDWSFLIYVAANSAAALDEIHDAGHVVGDLNQNNVLVGSNSRVFLIDSDSFQVKVSGRIFPCSVGVPEFTAPELQGIPFESVVRTPNHDNFCLAVMIFHLLFMGRHPFAGRYSDRKDRQLDAAIRDGLFAYSRNAALRSRVAPPPGIIDLAVLPRSVGELFEQAFTSPVRPSAKSWSEALFQMVKQLRQCASNRQHRFTTEAPGCFWCQLEANNGTVFFLGPQNSWQPPINVSRVGFSANDIAQFVSRFSRHSLPPLDISFYSPTATVVPLAVSPELLAYRAQLKLQEWSATGLAWGFWICSIAGFSNPKLWFGSLCLFFSWMGVREALAQEKKKSPLTQEQQDRRKALDLAKSKLQEATRRWENRKQQLRSEHERVSRQFLELKTGYESAARELPIALREAEQNWSAPQLASFLQSCLISRAKIDLIGDGRKAMLRSEGVETAYDVIQRGWYPSIPGFGPKIWGKVRSWAESMKLQFRPDVSKKSEVIAREKNRIQADFASRKQKLIAEFGALEKKVMDVCATANQEKSLNMRTIHQCQMELAQAEADWTLLAA